MIRISEHKLHEDVAALRAQLETDMNLGSASREALGRVLYWLNDPTAADLLRQVATQRHHFVGQNTLSLVQLGLLYRLAGDADQARDLWREAYGILRPRVQPRTAHDLFEIAQLIECCCLLEQDAEAEEWLQLAATLDDTIYPPPPVYVIAAQLSRARLKRDATVAAASVVQLERWIKRYHDRITGQILIDQPGAPLWDWFVIALQITAALDPTQAAALTPARVPGVSVPPSDAAASPYATALQRLTAYQVTQVEWVYYMWNTHHHVAFQQLTLQDGRVLAPEAIAELELLEVMWDCIEWPLNDYWGAVGVYTLDVASRTLRRGAEVLGGYEWAGQTEPTREDLAIRPLAAADPVLAL